VCMWRHRRITFCGEKMTHLLDLGWIDKCCVETCLIDCYLSDSGLYVHESCCLGVQRHLPTYESCSGFQDGHETSMKQMWCLISVTTSVRRRRW
jgi:hypothetical protein